MVQKIAKFLWVSLPQKLRLRLIRVSQPKFTASVAAAVFDEKGRVLLLKHVLRTSSGWGLPGGFIKSSEQPESAIQREICEETGLTILAPELIRVRTLGSHIEILFTALSTGHARVRSREITELGWFSIDSLPAGLPAGQESIIRTARKLRFDNFPAAD